MSIRLTSVPLPFLSLKAYGTIMPSGKILQACVRRSSTFNTFAVLNLFMSPISPSIKRADLMLIQEEVTKIGEKDIRVVYLTEPLIAEDVRELENAFHRLIAQLPFSLTKEIKSRLGKIEWILRKEENLKDVADEITRYKETIRGDDTRLTIGERIAMLERLETWRITIKKRVRL